MKLLIVESPAKSKTISKYLNDLPGDTEYVVKASVGHIRDLPKSNKKAIDIEAGFIPYYEITKGKEKIISELKKFSKKADEVLLATDPDREGEAIAWHIKEVTGLKNPKRIVFNEITKEAIQEAIKRPREIDDDLRKAQEARRVLDRLVGYDLSGLIWKKVRYGLSAGRVQSPALRIVMEKEREIRAFKPEDFWTITADVENKEKFTLTCAEEPRDKKEVDRITEVGEKGKWIVGDIKKTERKQSPKAPFITSTLQQTASNRLGFSPSKTMGVAQKLYESGYITYMRTDSTTLSSTAIEQMEKIIKKKYGETYFKLRIYKNKSKVAQEAHEAIRPTNFSLENAGANEEQKRLYKLIWTRTVSSQMEDAKISNTKIIATINDGEIPNFSINGSIILFDGWMKIDRDDGEKNNELPDVSVGEKLKLLKITPEAKQTQPPSRYTEAGLIKELEKRDIGRPSTYATIMKTLNDRGYVEKKNKTLFPTDTGDVVSSFIEQNFENYVSDSFTAEMENELDEIANGKRDYTKTLKDFYGPFNKIVMSKENIEKITNMGDAPSEFKCPECGADMVIKLSKNGKFMSCGKFPECNGARTIDGGIIDPPKETGELCPDCKTGKLIERHGRFGKFIACSNYPKCKFIKESENNTENLKNDTGVGCPICKKGTMVEKKGKFGIFYSCSNYPKCKNAIKAKPTGDICKECGSLMMEGTKTIPTRCSKKECPNHNPHKLKSS
ncbi:MAG: DNA topoisomerase I [Parcubacteria group bacterium Athens0714_16]|nr:MAG: DNA topoisomerase I [Parcubacteria group bacterium Athens0714_16]